MINSLYNELKSGSSKEGGKSQVNGLSLEYALVFLLDMRKCKYSRQIDNRKETLQKNFDILPTKTKINMITTLDGFLGNWEKCSSKKFLRVPIRYNLHNDKCGIKGDTTDIDIITERRTIQNKDIIYGKTSSSTEILHISLKYNNLSIKHQRPSNLPSQLSLSQQASANYRKQYTKLNESIYQKIKQYPTFNCVPDKNKIIKPIIDLAEDTFRKYCNSRVSKNLLSYLTGGKVNKLILMIKDAPKQDIEMYKFTPCDQTLYIVKRINDLNIQIIFGTDYIFNLRLHTASSRITKSLNFKFDTTLKNMRDFKIQNLQDTNEQDDETEPEIVLI